MDDAQLDRIVVDHWRRARDAVEIAPETEISVRADDVLVMCDVVQRAHGVVRARVACAHPVEPRLSLAIAVLAARMRHDG